MPNGLDEEASTLCRENSDILAKCSSEDKLVKYRTVAKEHGVVTTGARAQATLINAISGRLRAMLLQAGVIGGSKSGEASGLRLPNGFANDPEKWLQEHASDWKLMGWPDGLPKARVSAWSAAHSYTVLWLLLEGRIILASTAASSTSTPTRVTAPKEVDPPRPRPRKSLVGEEGRSTTGTAVPESDVDEKGDELEVMGLLDVAEVDDAPSPGGMSASAPPDSEGESSRTTKPKQKQKTVKERMLARKLKLPAPKVAVVNPDEEESEAEMSGASSSDQSSDEDDDSDEEHDSSAVQSTSKPPSPTKSVKSAKSVKLEPGTSKVKGKSKKRPLDSAAGDSSEPAQKKKRSRSSNAFDPAYKAALEKEKQAEKERKKAERERLREERAEAKEREKREKRELRAQREAAKELGLLAPEDGEKMDGIEESSTTGQKRRQSRVSDMGVGGRQAKRAKGDVDA